MGHERVQFLDLDFTWHYSSVRAEIISPDRLGLPADPDQEILRSAGPHGPPPWFIALGVLRPEILSFGPVAARYAYSFQSVSLAGGVFQLSASLFAESMTLAVCFAGDDANEEVVTRFLDFYESELPS